VAAEEAATIFSTPLGESPTAKVDLVAEAVELCDFQPNALLAAAERARHEGLDQTIDRLRRPEARLDVLRHGGRDVADRIASEYANLERREREAFLLLTIPESGTFVPWALQPLLGIESAEAANLMASISRVGLLELEGVDPSGFGRYRFSSLVRAFAEDRLRSGELSGDRLAKARDNFRRAYLAGALRVLARLGVKHLPKPRFDVPSYWYPQVRAWDDRVAKQLDFWVNAEFASLVPVVLEARRHGQLTACWQIAARLGDCYSPSAGHPEIRAAFEVAVAAARETRSVAGELRVRLARCGYLIAVHDYSAAVDELTATLSLARSVHDRAAEAQALRRLGQAWQELGYHDRAFEALREARTIAVGNMLRRERRLTELFLEEDEAIRDPSRWAYRSSAHEHAEDVRDNLQFQEKIIADRAACRRRDAMPTGLPKDTPRSAGNLASKYAVEHEAVAALLHWPPSGPGSAARSADLGARSAIWLAAQALRSAIRMGLPHAQAQARCDLAEALLRAGQVDDCHDHLAIATRCVRKLTHDESQHLTACLQRVQGEALLRRDQPREALAALEPTERWLAQREPWAHARVLVLLGNAQRMLPDFPAALAAHTGAAATFAQCRDYVALDRALAELSITLRLMGGQRSARRLERALAGSILRPGGSETATPGEGIEVEARRDRKAPEAAVGVTEMLEVRARRTPRQFWPVGHEGEPLAVRVLLTCDGAEIKPVTAVAKITKGGLDTPLFFKLTPRVAGELHIRAQVYEDNSGFLLREIETSITVVEPGRR
jgi:tetratricopeptide (TPR) repeat protein